MQTQSRAVEAQEEKGKAAGPKTKIAVGGSKG